MAVEEVIFDDSPMARYLQELEQDSKIQTCTLLNDEIMKALNEMSSPIQTENAVKNIERIESKENVSQNEDPKFIFYQYLEPDLYKEISANEALKSKEYYNLIAQSRIIDLESVDDQNSRDEPDPNPTPDTSLGNFNIKSDNNIRSKMMKNLGVMFVLLVLIMKGIIPTLMFVIFIYNTIVLFGRYRIRQFIQHNQIDHKNNLKIIQGFIDTSIKVDKLIKKVIITIGEVELVSRGYKLSYPLSPITRLEQNAKQRKCQLLRKQLSASLMTLDTRYKHVIDTFGIDLELSARTEDKNSLAYLKHIRARIHEMRTQFLVSFADTCQNKPMKSRDFVQQIDSLTATLANEKKIIETTLQKELYINKATANLPQVKKHKETLENQFILSVNTLQIQLQSIIARITLCKQDLSLYNLDAVDDTDDTDGPKNDIQKELNELMTHFSRIKIELEEAIKNWESSNSLLVKVIDKMNNERETKQQDDRTGFNNNSSELEYEPTIAVLERTEGTDEHNQVERVYEGSTAGEAEQDEDETDRRLKSREERILEMRKRRELQAQRQAAVLEKLAIIQELKGVLEVRAQTKNNSSNKVVHRPE